MMTRSNVRFVRGEDTRLDDTACVVILDRIAPSVELTSHDSGFELH